MFNFIIWKMEHAGLLINCLNCQCTWGVSDYSNYLIDEIRDDHKIPCPVCGRFITGAEIKVSMTQESDYEVTPLFDIEDLVMEEEKNKEVDDT